MPATIAVTLGDPAGIGPEVALRALARMGPQPDVRFLLIGAEATAVAANEAFGLGLTWRRVSPGESPTGEHRLALLQPEAEPTPAAPGPGDPAAARAALAWLTAGARLATEGGVQALVTGPVNKAAIIRTGARFVGQTEWVADISGARRHAMMLLGSDPGGRWLRVALATTHVPLREVPAALTVEKVAVAAELASEACLQLGLDRARIAVCGLNPHAGEEGCLGREDIEVVAPGVALAQSRGCDVSGPWPADTVFHHAWRGDFEAVVAMYHDQGLPPLKLIAFETGVNWTLGLPFPRLSPDHGTAYDIAWRGTANPSSFQAAIELSLRLVRAQTGRPAAPYSAGENRC